MDVSELTRDLNASPYLLLLPLGKSITNLFVSLLQHN